MIVQTPSHLEQTNGFKIREFSDVTAILLQKQIVDHEDNSLQKESARTLENLSE